MFYVKIAMIYAFFYAVTTFVALKTPVNNPALAFFIPSVFAMMFYGKFKLNSGKVNVAKHALCCGIIFSVTSVILAAIIQHFFDWLKNPTLLYLMAFGGNFLFPFLLFPKISNAQTP